MCENKIITIDGPSGVGKSTVAKMAARALGLSYLDTGAMYRALALQTKRENVGINSPVELESLLERTVITFKRRPDHILQLLLNHEDVTDKIRNPEISEISSNIATKGSVRKKLVELQREVGKAGGIVAEGRDMGTYVFPGADYKFYLDADIDIRARRRYKELQESGSDFELHNIRKQIEARDKRDMERSESPLHPARNAVIIDTTHLNADEVVFKIIKEVKGL